MLSTDLEALRGANLNWTMTVNTVWDDEDDHEDVPELHADLRENFAGALDSLITSKTSASPAGWVITGQGGTGKTHLLSRFRAECVKRNTCFVLIDLTDVRDFWEAVANGYYHSLQQVLPDGNPQFIRLLTGTLRQLKLNAPVETYIEGIGKLAAGKVLPYANKLLNALAGRFRAETVEHANVIRAVVGLSGGDIEVAGLAGTWLIGEALDPAGRAVLGLTKERERGSTIVRGLSWLMSLAGFSVVAMDQLDPIVTQQNIEKEGPKAAAASAIINKLGMGLCELRDVTRRTLTVVSCWQRTWQLMADHTPQQYADRYLPPRLLQPLKSEKVIESILVNRLAPAARVVGFTPPYPTWPFKPEWLQTYRNSSPREMLKAAYLHRDECLQRGEATEVPANGDSTIRPNGRKEALNLLDIRYLAIRTAVDLAGVFTAPKEDDQFGGMIQAALHATAMEVSPPQEIDVLVEKTFTGGKGNPPLHARLRLVFNGESSREEHVCLRALQQTNARAFQTRLRSAITFAGIDKSLQFRRLYVLRRGPVPAGAATQTLLKDFTDLGGRWLDPNDNDLRTLEALRVMLQEADPHLSAWMKSRQHASKTMLAQAALAPLFRLLDEAAPAANAGDATGKPAVATVPPPAAAQKVIPPTVTPPAAVPGASTGTPTVVPAASGTSLTSSKPPDLLLGRRLVAGSPTGQPTTMPVAALQKHGIIFAGAGSGKTVLLKRLIEGAALAGVPSIVVDCANDLASLGDTWTAAPAQWEPGDAALAERFRADTDRVVWTPNRDAGNPIGLEPLPDLAALVNSPDEFNEALAMAVDALTPIVVTGTAAKAAKKQAVLTKALAYLGRNGNCNLDGLGGVLGDFPPPESSTGIRDEGKLGTDMADDLHAQLTINPLLRSAGPVLDPAVLLTGTGGKTRISVISLVGLGGQGEQQHFVNQLAMTLFAWIKKHPTPAGKPLRGLLVIDEARDFIPSGKGSACLASMQRLAAQARKYGLGILLATQNPKDVDNKIVGQCSTHWYGKMSSPAAIDAAEELLAGRGARAGDAVGALRAGTFFVSNADHLPGAVRLATPMCLSAHAGPMAPEAVVARAAASRAAAAARG